MGGGGFTMESTLALDRFALELTGKPVPRICFLPTASGDPREQTTRFHERFSAWPCEPVDPVAVSPWPRPDRPARAPAGPGRDLRRRRLDAQHARGLARALGRRDDARRLGARDRARRAERRGDVLVRGWDHDERRLRGADVDGLGLVGGSLSVHMDGEPERLPVFRAGDRDRDGCRPASPPTTALRSLLRGTELERCVASRAGARVISVGADGEGGTVERELPVTALAGAVPAVTRPTEPPRPSPRRDRRAVSACRALRGGRHVGTGRRAGTERALCSDALVASGKSKRARKRRSSSAARRAPSRRPGARTWPSKQAATENVRRRSGRDARRRGRASGRAVRQVPVSEFAIFAGLVAAIVRLRVDHPAIGADRRAGDLRAGDDGGRRSRAFHRLPSAYRAARRDPGDRGRAGARGAVRRPVERALLLLAVVPVYVIVFFALRRQFISARRARVVEGRAAAGAGQLIRSGPRRAAECSTGSGCAVGLVVADRRRRQRQREHGAAGGRVGDRGGAAVLLGDLADDRQSEPGPLAPARVAAPVEAVEQVGEVGFDRRRRRGRGRVTPAGPA